MKQRSRGQSLVEFGLVLPVLLLLFMAIFDFGRLIYAYNTVSNAARAGAREAVIDQNVAVIEARAKTVFLGLPSADITVNSSWPNCPTPANRKIGCTSSVTVSYSWSAITPIIGRIIGPISVSATASMPLERVHSSP